MPNKVTSHHNQECRYPKCPQATKPHGLASTKFKVCQRCSVACYCSKECQKAHFKVHKKECKTLAQKGTAVTGAQRLDQTLPKDSVLGRPVTKE